MSAAVAYAERLGLSVFGVGADCRSPIKVPGVYERGVHDATNDVAEIRRRWTRHPRANIALACGKVSGVFALDIDAKGNVDGYASLGALEGRFGPLPASWRSMTPSGGEHRFFRQPPNLILRNKVGLRIYDSQGRIEHIFPGLDIRTDGGSTALPPSRKPHGEYRWAARPTETPLADAPLWLLKLAMDQPAPPKPNRAALRGESSARLARYVDKAIDSECGSVASTKSGRNVRLFQAACRLGELVGAGILPQSLAEAELVEAANSCGLLQEDGAHSVRQTIASGLRRGIANPREVQS
jgi:hypothetical protein